MRLLKCGVIGVGYLGRFHAQKYKLIENAELVGISDASAKRSDEIAQELSVESFHDYKSLLSKVQAVTIAASTLSHYEIAKEALERGVHVLIEKPITAHSEQADELLRIARSKNLKIQVGHVERFNPAFVAAQKLVSKPLFIDCERFAPFNLRGSDVNVILDLMIHDLDLVLALAKSPVRNVSALGSTVVTQELDLANVRIEFESGCVANINASRISQNTSRKFRVFQKDTFVNMDLAQIKLDVTRKEGKLQGTTLPFKTESQSFEKPDALLNETKSFINAVVSGENPVISGEDGYRALQLAEQIVDIIHTQRH